MSKPTTAKQRQALIFINAYHRTKQKMPTYREISKSMGSSSPSVSYWHVQKLIKKGLLQHINIVRHVSMGKRKPKPTPQRDKVLAFIKSYNLEKQNMPTYREIGEHMGTSSSSTTFFHVQELIRTGYLRRDKFKSRSLYIVDRD